MPSINRTLFDASFSKRPKETEEDFRRRIDLAATLANQAMGGEPDLILWEGPEISVTLTRAEAEVLYKELDSLIPHGEHQIDAPPYLGNQALQRFMYFLRTGNRTPYLKGP